MLDVARSLSALQLVAQPHKPANPAVYRPLPPLSSLGNAIAGLAPFLWMMHQLYGLHGLPFQPLAPHQQCIPLRFTILCDRATGPAWEEQRVWSVPHLITTQWVRLNSPNRWQHSQNMPNLMHLRCINCNPKSLDPESTSNRSRTLTLNFFLFECLSMHDREFHGNNPTLTYLINVSPPLAVRNAYRIARISIS